MRKGKSAYDMSRERDKSRSTILSGFCPDKRCRSKLFFPNFDTSIECTHCGQRHDKSALQGVQEVSNLDARLNDMIRNILMSNIIPKRGTETVKVLGLSNYHCKLLSPLLTKYGMDKRTGKARLLSDMNQGDIFDCGLFGDRAFLIEPEHIAVPGFGRDITGSMCYLSRTLDLIKRVNDDEERLIPIHADGDGHCLVHAVSRALVGRELFWHPLRCSLKKHFQDNLRTYKDLFKDFVDECEWRFIIDECDPEFIPPEGELMGLRNIHVFGLANVLKRPIILLDSFECMNSLGDYAALFLPSLVSPVLCRGKDNRLNKPLCIAWSSSGHNHYIPLVGIKKKPLPVLPVGLLPKAWGVPQSQILTYMELDENSHCTIGGDRNLGDPYILRLVSAMEELFLEQYGVHPALVADVHHYLYQNTGFISVDRDMVIHNTRKAVEEGRLYRCLNCEAVCEQLIKTQWFQCDGVLYKMALLEYGAFIPNQLYPFPLHGIVCRYNAHTNELVPDLARSALENCTWCNANAVRKVRADGGILYRNEDKTKTPSNSSLCGCGFKHFWAGKEYDNPPQKLNVTLDWNNQVVKDTVVWFEKESDPSLNSNVYQVASEVVQKHFPGEFGSERLMQRIVEQILMQTKPSEASCVLEDVSTQPDDTLPETMQSNKIIIGGTGVLHKEELGMSKTEEQILQNVQRNAEITQRKHSEESALIPSQEHPVRNQEVPIPNQEVLILNQEVLIPNQQDSIPNEECCPNVVAKKSDVATEVEGEQEPVVPPVPEGTQELDKFVRVVTSDGRQGKLMLGSSGVYYKQLQDWIKEEFDVPPSRQRLKLGFPPQELHFDAPEIVLQLSHGDRLTVEIIPGETSTSSDMRKKALSLVASGNESSSLDSVLHSMSTILCSEKIWFHVKSRPELFRRGGHFYSQLASHQVLVDKKHYSLVVFPNMIFSYDASSDSLKLCIESLGHFVVDSDTDQNIEEVRASGLPSLFVSPCPLAPKEKGSPSASSSSSIAQQARPRSLVRKGPGFSVLSPPEWSPEAQVGMLQSLANQLTSGSCNWKDIEGELSGAAHSYSESNVDSRRKTGGLFALQKLSESGSKTGKKNFLSSRRLASDSECDNSDMDTDST